MSMSGRSVAPDIDSCQYDEHADVARAPTPTRGARLLRAAGPRAPVGRGRKPTRRGAEGAGGPGPAAPAQPDPGTSGRGGVRLRPRRAARAVPAHRQPPPEGAA